MTIPQPTTAPVIEGQIVTMPPRLMWQCEMWGFDRHVTAIEEGKRERTLSGRDPVAVHIDGVRGEVAFHWWLTGEGFTPTNGTYRTKADIGEDLEVRCRVYNPGQTWPTELIVRSDDDPEKRYVLIINDRTIGYSSFVVKGWVNGRDAMRPDWKKNHGKWGAAWFVPHEAMRSVEELRA